jgi:hypothetical protein
VTIVRASLHYLVCETDSAVTRGSRILIRQFGGGLLGCHADRHCFQIGGSAGDRLGAVADAIDQRGEI